MSQMQAAQHGWGASEPTTGGDSVQACVFDDQMSAGLHRLEVYVPYKGPTSPEAIQLSCSCAAWLGTGTATS